MASVITKRVSTKVPKSYYDYDDIDFSGTFDFEDQLGRGELSIRALDYNPAYPSETSNIWVVGFKCHGEKGQKTSDGLNFYIPTLEYEHFDIERDAASINLAIGRERWWEHCWANKLKSDCKCTSVIRVVRTNPTFLEDEKKLYLYSWIGFVGFQRKPKQT
jgi:hypothetical protein